MSNSNELLDENKALAALHTAREELKAEADDETSSRATAAEQLRLEVDDVLRRWSGEVAASE